IDPNLSIAGAGLPYTQTSAGSLNVPSSPRVMILSSTGSPLPAGISSGVATAADFTNTWDSADGTVPSAPAFAGWSGSGDDLKIQRITLPPLFVRLLLTTNVSNSAYYSIDSTNWADRYNVPSPGRDGYFIRNSVLFLYQQ